MHAEWALNRVCMVVVGGNGVTVNHLSVSGTSFVSSKHDGKLVSDLLQQINLSVANVYLVLKSCFKNDR